jgi:pimeloyl-ACP methyl ester carboxylesterase
MRPQKFIFLLSFIFFAVVFSTASASTIYSQSNIGTNIQLGTSEPNPTRYYGYYFGGATLGNPPTDLGYWSATAVINKMRVKRVSGVSCVAISNSALMFDSNLNSIGGGGLSFHGTSFGDYCDMTTLADIPIGTKIAAIYLVGGNVGAAEMVLDGSPANPGISINGNNDAQTNGGFAFQLCSNYECEAIFSPPAVAEKSITAFSFENLTPKVDSSIDETNHVITLNVPFGTDVTALVPSITISSGASVNPNSDLAQDFSNPVTYTVTGSDGSTQNYIVTVVSACTENCFSNVLFLPGLMGSRLYEPAGSGDKELWVSTNDSDQADLALDSQGKSVDSTIHTKNDTQNNGETDETGIVDDVYSFNTYQSFITDLKNWKQEGTIADYAFIPYDWRLSLNDVITNGSISLDVNLSYNITQNFSESFILKKLEALQANSKSGKVTIITHSNGGLVAKALIQKLQDTINPLYDKIDKIIFVAVPQVGTPNSIIGLLHGSDLGHGFIMNAERSRQLSENMASVYNLLPSAGYFTTVDPAFAVDKVVSFKDTPFFNPQTSQYGVYVSNETELKNYILGTDGRTKPSFSDTVHPNIGNSTLYSQAEDVHQILDNWQPSPNTKVIQVAGWGEETLAGLDYESIRDVTEHLSYKPRMVVDGDGTVVVPSALWMPEASNVERWWVDLKKYNEQEVISRKHRDVLEVPNLLDFLQNEIEDSAFTDSSNIVVNNSATLISNKPRLHYTLHSPLTLGITDMQGRYTGQDPVTREIREEIPNVTYKQIGDVQFISAPAGVAYILKMKGYQSGNFSLDEDKQEGNNITGSTSFQGISSSTTTVATVDIAPNQEIANSTLKIDQNGDGTVDKTLQATPDGITVYDVTPPELQVTFDLNTKDVIFSAQDLIDPHPTITKTNTSIMLADNAGNTTIIPFNKLRELPTRTRLTYNKITRNGVMTTIPNTNIVYDWKEKNGVLKDLDTKVTVKGIERYVFNYKKANNVTIIKEKTSSGIVTTTRSGFMAVTVKTEGDGVKVDY